METPRGYPSDVIDDEWAYVAPYLCLLPEDAGQRVHDLREVFNALRWVIKTGSQWRYLPNDYPPWPSVYQQARRWVAVGCFEAMTHDLREILRLAAGRNPTPTAAIFDERSAPPRKVALGPGTMDTRRRRGRRCILPSIPWEICWL